MNKIKVIIFDYDGVIAESVNVKTDAFAEIYRPYGNKVVNNVINHHESHGGVSRFEKFKIYHKKFLKKDLNKDDLKKLTDLFSNLILEKVISSNYVDGVMNFIKNNHRKYKFFISTGTPKNEIDIILKRNNIKKYFIEVFGSPEKKVLHVNKIINKYDFNINEMVFIGDSLSDRDAAVSNGIKFIGRYTTVEEIKKEKYLINNFNNFNNFLKNL